MNMSRQLGFKGGTGNSVSMHFKYPSLFPDLNWKLLSCKLPGGCFSSNAFMALPLARTLILRTFYLGPYLLMFLLHLFLNGPLLAGRFLGCITSPVLRSALYTLRVGSVKQRVFPVLTHLEGVTNSDISSLGLATLPLTSLQTH